MNEIDRQALVRLDGAVARLKATIGPSDPGFCLALVSGTQVLRQVHYGMANLEWQQPIAGDTRFYLASEAKPWVAALVMELVVSGQIQLDDDVRALLPALKSYEQPIQLGHLLRHTSGIEDYLFLWGAQLGHHEHDLVTQSQALELIRRADDVRFTPGARHDYSNSNYVLLAELVRELEGADIAEIARQRYFEPWGMPDTSFEQQRWRVMPRRARSYGRDPAVPGAWLDVPVPMSSWGDGGLWSTLDDLIVAEQRWLADWPRSMLAQCCVKDDRFAPPGESYRFGLDVIDYASQEFVFHGGAYAAFTSLVLRRPEPALSLIVLSNAEGIDTHASTWLKSLWGDPLSPP